MDADRIRPGFARNGHTKGVEEESDQKDAMALMEASDESAASND